MSFEEVVDQATEMLKRRGRVADRMLKRQFELDDESLEDLKETILYAHPKEVSDDGRGLTWAGDTSALVNPSSHSPHAMQSPTTVDAESRPVNASPPVVALDAERRQLTVMFCDLVGSTDLSGKLDPEDLREVVRAYQETAAEVIQRYEGHIAQYLGDGLLIYFGYPVAHENDAQRAVYTGLGIPEAMATLNTRLETEYGVQLAVRIGIHTGPVVVGEMGGGGRHENLALGETPNIAARLEGLASANTAVISSVTAQLARRSFILEELGPHELKGVAEPMMLYAAVSSRETQSDDEAMLAGGFDVLVGRDNEIGLLLRHWELSKEGHEQVVLLSGEAGIGKSALVGGLRDHVSQEGFTCIAFRCSPYHSNSAFYPIIAYLHRALDWKPDETADTQLATLEQVLGRTSLPLEEAVPLLGSLLSLSLPEERYPALRLSPQQQRQQTQDILVAWLLAVSEKQPVLVVWEDLHWIDPTTLDFLSLLINQRSQAPILHVLTSRPEFDSPWESNESLAFLTVNRLDASGIAALTLHITRGKVLPLELLEQLIEKTDGVPLFVEELTKTVMESGVLQAINGRYELTQPVSAIEIPFTLQDA